MPQLDNKSPLSASNGHRRSNVSLPEKGAIYEIESAPSRRNTLADETGYKPRKKVKPPSTPTIPEDGSTDPMEKAAAAFAVENETRKLTRKGSDVSRVSAVSGKSTNKVPHTYENKAYEGSLKRDDVRNDSVRTNASSRAPSVQSLEVYREQYCCCSRRTKCERYLIATVSFLSLIIAVLVVVIVVLGKDNKLDSLSKLGNL